MKLPFYGFFIGEITLTNLTYIPGNQTVIAGFGESFHTFSPKDQNVTLTNLDFNPILTLDIIGNTWNASILFIESIEVQLSFMRMGLIGFLSALISLIIFSLICSTQAYFDQKRKKYFDDNIPFIQ